MNKIFIPLSIIVSGLIIAGAIFITRGVDNTNTVSENPSETADFSIRPINENDHILGNPEADIIIVEYSDYECPFCARFHPTMERIMSEYGESGQVAWAYRHFPISKHLRAKPAANASECVADLGGNGAFWNFTKSVFADQKNSLTDEGLTQAAIEAGVNEEEFKSCFSENRFDNNVKEDYEDGLILSSADPDFGTPYSIAIHKDGKVAPIRGAQPYEVVKGIIDQMLAE